MFGSFFLDLAARIGVEKEKIIRKRHYFDFIVSQLKGKKGTESTIGMFVSVKPVNIYVSHNLQVSHGMYTDDLNVFH